MLIYILKSKGLRQLPCGRPVKVERILYELKGKKKKRFLRLKRENNMLQNLAGACKERRCEIRVEILTESKAPWISTKKCLLLKE
jgi:hypothetical protein